MDRIFAYTGAIPQNTDILSTNKNTLYGLGHIIQAALGTGTCVVGLAGAQSTVPNLYISIGPGAIYSSQTVDASAYGDLGTDVNTVMKQGILKAAQTLALTPPGTSGYSQVYLVEATYSDTDGGTTVLPYYNSSNPSAPYAGPANAGTSNYTVRQGVCTITLKAGTAAPTGTQTAPSTDAGYIPLYTITLVNGQTAITTAQIITAAGAPFVPYNLNNLPFLKVQTDTGTANALAVAEPAMTGAVAGQTLLVKKSSATNTGPVTLNINGTGAAVVAWADGSVLAAGDWMANATAIVEYDGLKFNLLSVMGPTVFSRAWGMITDTGTANAVAVAVVGISGAQAGQVFAIEKSSNANTGAVTINVNGTGAGTLVWPDGSALAAGDWPANVTGLVEWDGSKWNLLSVMGPSVFARSRNGVSYATDTGTANALVVSNPALSSSFVGMTLLIKKSAAANTGPVNININGWGAANCNWADGTPLASGDWPANTTALVEYDGVNMNVLSVMGPSVYLRQATRANVIYATPGTFSWTCPASVYSVLATVTGGGGGAQGIASTGQLGATGGAGGTSIKRVAVTPGTVYTIIVGAGGAGGSSSTSYLGGTGGSSSAFTATGNGGQGGSILSSFVNGFGGAASGGDINISGGDGMDGTASYSGAYGTSTNGGGSYWGGGPSSGTATVPAPSIPGVGGASVYTGIANGGPGAPGIVVLEY